MPIFQAILAKNIPYGLNKLNPLLVTSAWSGPGELRH